MRSRDVPSAPRSPIKPGSLRRFTDGAIGNAVLACGAALLFGCSTVRDDFPEIVEPPTAGAPDINLDEYDLTFNEEFDKLNVSAWDCDSKWIAHTPWAGDFGDAAFADPMRNFPFITANGLLRIEASKSGGKWRSGLLSGGNQCGGGFRQQYGYFEMRAKLPPGEGTWPAFWLIGKDFKDEYTAEIDVIEHYGNDPDAYWSHIHIHPAQDKKEAKFELGKKFDIPRSILYQYFNTFGVSIETDYIKFYFNRKEYWRIETKDEFKQKFFPLVNLALGSGWPIENTPNPSYMYVDYIKIYKRRDG